MNGEALTTTFPRSSYEMMQFKGDNLSRECRYLLISTFITKVGIGINTHFKVGDTCNEMHKKSLQHSFLSGDFSSANLASANLPRDFIFSVEFRSLLGSSCARSFQCLWKRFHERLSSIRGVLTFDIFRAGSWFESVHYYSSVSRWYTNYLRNKICSEKPRGPSHRSISWLLMASESDARLQQQNGFSVSGCSQWISISLMNSRSIKVSSTLSDWRVRTLMGNGHWKNRPFHCGSSLPSEIISFRFEIRSTHSSIRYSAGSIQSVESLHHSRKREIWNSCFVRKWLKLRVYFRLSMFWTHRPDSVCRQRRISQM